VLRALDEARRALWAMTEMPDPEPDANNPRSAEAISDWVGAVVDAQALLWTVGLGYDLLMSSAPPACWPEPRTRAGPDRPPHPTGRPHER
jgi:hypothetical protein